MSSQKCDAPFTTRSSLESDETIALVALQALQKQSGMMLDENEMSKSIPTSELVPLPSMDSAARVVSTQTNDSADESKSLPPLPSQAEEKESTMPASKSPSAVTVLKSLDADPSADKPPLSTSVQSLPASSITPDNDIDSKKGNEDPLKPADFSAILSDPEGWLQQTENSFANLPPIDHSPIGHSNVVVKPNDVLCGRGGETNHHPGNVQYRSLVKAYQKLYLLAKRRDKPKIAQCIVVSIRGVNGRFLKRMKNPKKVGGCYWVDVGNVKAREKTSQALREGAPDLRETVNNSTRATTSTTDHRRNHGMLPTEREETTSVSLTPMASRPPRQLEKLMGWSNSINANKPASPLSPTNSSSETDTTAVCEKAFAAGTKRLMQHPAFHTLDPVLQQQAVLYEFELAQSAASATAAKEAASKALLPPTIQGTTSPIYPQEIPPHELPYYAHNYFPHHFNYYPGEGLLDSHKASDIATGKTPATITSGDIPYPHKCRANVEFYLHLQSFFNKAAASSGDHSMIARMNNKENGTAHTLTNDHKRNMNKRSAPSAPSMITSMDTAPSAKCSSHSSSPPTVVSDTGSERSSSSSLASSCSSSSAKITTTVENKKEIISSSVSRRGSRVKRLKLRMQSDCKSE